ncbi:MAG: agmatinase family protein [Chitinophagales bacterium]|jgi:agmatinase
MDFNPNALGLDNGNLYGLPSTFKDAEVIVFPVPWDVTVSYGDGTSQAPDLIREESLQVDLYDLEYGNFWEKGIFYLKSSPIFLEKCAKNRQYAVEAIKLQEKGRTVADSFTLKSNTEQVNQACEEMVDWVYKECGKVLSEDKKLVLLGGDHSTPLGYLKALGDKYKDFGILQIDAHCDLREAYEGFTYSHASIMYNALKLDYVKSLTQVGIRDFCEDEKDFAKKSKKKVNIFFDRDMSYQMIEGKTWKSICDEIVKTLPKNIYISFDIDGLQQKYCPNTGTPVAGGLEVDQVFYLFNQVKKAGKTIIGMDLNEVGNDVWDANVGARVLYRMIGTWIGN